MLKVSIITVVLNNKTFIEDCIRSVIGQTYANIEYIIVDGGSVDGTCDIIKKYSGNISIWISEPDKGIYDAMNKGITLATGNIIGFVHADDMLNDKFVISNIVNSFIAQNADAIYGDALIVQRGNINSIYRKWMSGHFKKDSFKYGWAPPHLSFYVKKDIHNKYGFYRTDLKISADYEFMLRVLYLHDIKVNYLPIFIPRFRMGGTSTKSIYSILKSNYECYLAWKLNGIAMPIYTIPLKLFSKLKQLTNILKKPSVTIQSNTADKDE